MKKFLTAGILALALALSAGAAGCAHNGAGGDGKFGSLTTAESVYGFSAASAGMLISSMNGGGAAQLAAAKSLSYAGVRSSAAEAEERDLSELDRYMALVESLLSDGGFSADVQASDKSEYTEKMTVSYKDLQGNALQYVLYYNRLPIEDDDDDDDDRFDGEREENYAIDGVMEIDGAYYDVEGYREIETERGESESETRFRVTLSDARYMLVEQETESEEGESEQEYRYSVYEGRSLVERSAFSYERERGETELKMTAYKDGVRETLYFERETVRGKEVIRLRIDGDRNAESYYVHIVADDGGVRYEYEPIRR